MDSLPEPPELREALLGTGHAGVSPFASESRGVSPFAADTQHMSPVHFDPAAARASRRNFLCMCLFTVTTAACAEVPLGFATTLLEPSIGQIGTAILFLCMVLSSLVVSPAVVARLGSKHALLVGLTLQTLYIAGFAAAAFSGRGGAEQAAMFVCASACSGVGAGVLWTAQGAFFVQSSAIVALKEHHQEDLQLPDADPVWPQPQPGSATRSKSFFPRSKPLVKRVRSVREEQNEPMLRLDFTLALEHYSESAGKFSKEVTNDLASQWASLFLCFDVVIKTACTVSQGVNPFDGSTGKPLAPLKQVFFGMACMSACATVGLALMVQDPERRTRGSQAAGGKSNDRVRAALALMGDPVIWLLAPMNVSFGLAGGLLNGYVNAEFAVPNPFFGRACLGVLMAVTPLSAMVGSLLLTPMTKRVGKSAGFAVGAFAYGSLALSIIACTPSRANTFWGRALIILYMLQGLGRGVYESTCRAAFADLFPGEASVGAFANCLLQTGLAFFASFSLQKLLPVAVCGPTLAWLVLCTSLLALPCYRLARKRREVQPDPGRMLSTSSLLPDERLRAISY